jgi:hypothetical protein
VDNSSPFDWQISEDDADRERRLDEVREACSRMRRVFEENPEGAAILNDWRRSTVEAVRGATAREPYTLGYMDGQSDVVRTIDRMIRMSKEGIE